MAENVREFFESIPERVRPERARALQASYRFDIADAGSWCLESDGERLAVSESDAPAECIIRTDERTFLRIVNREQSAMGAYMTGKIKVEGDLGLALQLRELFGS